MHHGRQKPVNDYKYVIANDLVEIRSLLNLTSESEAPTLRRFMIPISEYQVTKS